MNEPVAVSLHQKDSNHSCKKCGMESKQGCCLDEVSIIKLTDSHSVINADINLKAPQTVSIQFWVLNTIEKFQSEQTAQCRHLPPLLHSKINPQALICVFRI